MYVYKFTFWTIIDIDTRRQVICIYKCDFTILPHIMMTLFTATTFIELFILTMIILELFKWTFRIIILFKSLSIKPALNWIGRSKRVFIIECFTILVLIIYAKLYYLYMRNALKSRLGSTLFGLGKRRQSNAKGGSVFKLVRCLTLFEFNFSLHLQGS